MDGNGKNDREELLRTAALVAHQIRAPIASAGSIVKALLGEFAGHLSSRQKDLLARADQRIEEAVGTVGRMLAIVRADRDENQVTDVAAMIRRTHQQYAAEVATRGISLSVDIRLEPAHVRIADSCLAEALRALVNNAIKYTPDNGQIRLMVAPADREGVIRVSVADSGIGVPEEHQEKVFEPFFRGLAAEGSSRPGVGLGLAFAKAMIDGAGGSISVRKSDLGGAEFRVQLPQVADPDARKPSPAAAPRMKVVIVGGVAAGPKVAAKVIRLKPETEVTIVERGAFLSYAGCGLPYYISGVVKEQRDLLATPLGAVRDLVFFQNVKNVNVLSRTEAVEIDRAAKRVRIVSLERNESHWAPYDKLVLATGAAPIVPPLPGVGLRNIFTLHGVHDAEGIRNHLAEGVARDVVLVGGGLIAVEMTEALVARGCRVTMVEMQDQILGMLDQGMAKLLEQHMESHGVRVMTGTRALEFVGSDVVSRVVTSRGDIPADMVILGVGVRPQIDLALAAGLEIGPTGAIRVDEHMRTSDPDIYAAGDCVECQDLITGRPCYVPLGSTANKQGRVAAVNICGGHETFPGVVGSTVCKVFDYCVARTGLTEKQAAALGYDVVTALAPSPDREHFMPGAQCLMLKLIVDGKTRKLLGAQSVGPGHGDKRIDIVATALTARMTVDQVSHLDLSYAPPYSPAMDNLITAANIVKNKLAGLMVGIRPEEVHAKRQQGEDFVLLDVSTPGEYEEVRLPGSTHIPLGSLRGRLHELPRDKEIVAFCRISIRGYEASLILKAAGFTRTKVLDGGIAMWPYEKVYGKLF